MYGSNKVTPKQSKSKTQTINFQEKAENTIPLPAKKIIKSRNYSRKSPIRKQSATRKSTQTLNAYHPPALNMTRKMFRTESLNGPISSTSLTRASARYSKLHKNHQNIWEGQLKLITLSHYIIISEFEFYLDYLFFQFKFELLNINLLFI